MNFQHPDYYAFSKAFEPVVETTAYLNKDNAKEEIDRILEVFTRTKRPVYLAIPMDIALMEIDGDILIKESKSDERTLKSFIEKASEMINNAKSPVIIGDTLIKRFQCEEIYKKWIKKTGASAGKQYTFSTQHNNSPSAPGVSPIFSGVSPAQVSAVKKLCIHLP